MPNKNRSKNKTVYYSNEHDDRVHQASNFDTRRVSFKNYGNNRYKNARQRGRDDKMRVALAIHDEDVEMMIGSSLHRGHNSPDARSLYQRGIQRRGRGGMRRDSPNPGRKLPESPVLWYKVTIPEGHRYESSYLLGLLASYIKPLPFAPLGFTKQSDSIFFHIEDYKVAQQLMLADRKITTNDNWRLAIVVRANIPQINIDDRMRALMKLAMSGRYNVINKALDLTKFHADPVFEKECVFCPLNRTNVLINAVQIIADNLPDLVALKLAENKLVTVDGLKLLKTKTPHLRILHINKNNIRFIEQFDCLQGLQIEELELDLNPLCMKFREKDAYIRYCFDTG